VNLRGCEPLALAGLGAVGGNLAGEKLPGGRARDDGRPAGRLRGCLLYRADDPVVRSAAAQIAVQSLPHLLLGRGGTVVQQADRGHHHAGGAIAALDGLLVDERLLDRMKLAVTTRQPL